MLGKITYNDEGLLKCELCGQYFNRLGNHVRQKHGMSAKEYKKLQGLDIGKGLCSETSRAKSRKAVFKHRELCIEGNLLKAGECTRFTNGHPGRTRDKISAQTMQVLKKMWSRR